MGKTCCFFGHREVPEAIGEKLTAVVMSLIADGFDTFYVGEEGAFDRLTQRVLSRMQAANPAVSCFVVHAYLPKEEPVLPGLFPAELERVPPRFAIERRNRWMLARADAVVSYVRSFSGGAAKTVRLAEARGIPVSRV